MEKRLGKGLGALIPEDTGKGKERVESIKLTDIVPNPFQPRKKFNQDKLEDLISSIKEKGVIQPILVRKSDSGYELIAGERRWRAAGELELDEIPAIIKTDIDNVSSLEISLIENIQREELNPIEEANAYKELIDEFEYTLDQVGKAVGKDKTTISNIMRLLNLSKEIQGYVEDGALSTGHAKVLLSIPNEYRRTKLAKTIIKQGFSVRQLEQLIKAKTKVRTKSRQQDPELRRIEEDLQHKLGTKCRINHGKKRGHIEIQYYSNEDLQRLLGIILEA